MITVPPPEMLWESTDPAAELTRRFEFGSAGAAADWASGLLADEYGVRVVSFDRMVISAQNLMIWVTTADAGRLMIKICRLAIVHDWLSARADLVDWLADRELPVARPLRSLEGKRQLLRAGRSVGVHPVLAGDLLDATDHDQVRAAGGVLADLHDACAEWPEVARLDQPAPIPGRELWTPRDRAPGDLRKQLEARIVELPELPRQPVHTDYRGANLLSQHGKITGIIDFEETRLDPAVVDLAHAVCLLGTWFRNWQPISPEAQTILIDSYAERRPLSEEERAWLPPLVAWGMLGPGWADEARRWLQD